MFQIPSLATDCTLSRDSIEIAIILMNLYPHFKNISFYCLTWINICSAETVPALGSSLEKETALSSKLNFSGAP